MTLKIGVIIAYENQCNVANLSNIKVTIIRRNWQRRTEFGSVKTYAIVVVNVRLYRLSYDVR